MSGNFEKEKNHDFLIGDDRPLNNRSVVVLVTSHKVKDQSQDDSAPEHHHRPIHRGKSHRQLGREEAEHGTQNQEAHRERVDREPYSVRQTEGTPFHLLATHALDHQEDDRDHVGDEEAGDGQRNNGVESDGREHIDQADQRSDYAAEGDGV